MALPTTGILTAWSRKRRFGFISPTDAPAPGRKRIFLHASRVISGTPKLRRRCHFETLENDSGVFAMNVRVEGSEGNHEP